MNVSKFQHNGQNYQTVLKSGPHGEDFEKTDHLGNHIESVVADGGDIEGAISGFRGRLDNGHFTRAKEALRATGEVFRRGLG